MDYTETEHKIKIQKLFRQTNNPLSIITQEDDNGFAPRYAIQDQETGRNIYYETTWTLVERIADEGGSSETIQIENLKGLAGQACQRTGNWWSPANQLQSRYFEQGEVFPEIENNSWGETIWYLEVTNKK